jgi:hypothetical protein
MKTIPTVMLVTLMIVSVQSFAQFNKGRWLADGTMSLSWNKVESYQPSIDKTITTNSNGFNLAPRVGYFLFDRFAAGLILNAGTSKNEYETYDFFSGTVIKATSHSKSISVGPFVRYYLPVPVFFQASATFGGQRIEYDEPATAGQIKSSLKKWSLAAGYAYFLNDYVAIEPSIGYQSDVTKNKDNDSKSTVRSIALSAALTIYLGERK